MDKKDPPKEVVVSQFTYKNKQYFCNPEGDIFNEKAQKIGLIKSVDRNGNLKCKFLPTQ
jgi:hypothetical protein